MRITLAALVLALPASAQDITFPDFSSTAGLVFNEDATTSGTALRVTSAALSERGTIFWDQPMAVSAGFDTVFEFQFSSPSAGGGDGMTFIIQNDIRGTAAFGNHASQMGYGAFSGAPAGTAISNCLVVEIDTYQGGNDTSGNEISIHTNGPAECTGDELLSIASTTPATLFNSDGLVHQLRIAYTPGLIDVYLDDLVNPTLSAFYDFGVGGTWLNMQPVTGLDLIGGTSAYIGFTASNGGAWENHDVLSWNWTSVNPIATPFCTSAPNSSGVAATISADGSASLAANDLLLIGDGMPPGQPGIFYYGPDSLQVPFGDGFRCVGGSAGTVKRIFPFVTADMAGHVDRTVDNTNPTHAASFLASATLRFQIWYRDPAAAMTGFNLSDGIEITFAP